METGFEKRAATDLVNRFLSFDKLMGEGLVKFVYYVGLALLALGVVFNMFAGFAMGFGTGLLTLFGAPLFGLVGVLMWRFACELYIVLFKLGADMSAVRASLAAGEKPIDIDVAEPPAGADRDDAPKDDA